MKIVWLIIRNSAIIYCINMDNELIVNRQENDIIFSRSVKAGRRIYYFDVKENNNGDLFLAITESKRIMPHEETQVVQFEKHKIFLYPKDFEKFVDGMNEVMDYIKNSLEQK